MAQPQQLREDVATVATLSVEQLEDLVGDLTGDALFQALQDLLPGLIDSFAEAAATVAADWYEEFRDDLGVGGDYSAFVPDLQDPGVQRLVDWAEAQARSEIAAMSLVEGGVQRRVANGARRTIMDNAAADPKATGWQRVARAEGGCSFCRMLAGRATLYRSEWGARFGAHDNCKCTAAPAFGGAPLAVRPYTPSPRNITDADRARLRDYLRENYPEAGA